LSTVRWNVDTDGFWSVAGNWLDESTMVARVPGPSDDVVIDRAAANPRITINTGGQSVRSVTSHETLEILAGSLTVAATSTVHQDFIIGGGTVIPNGPLTVSGNTTWSGGTISGSNVLTNSGAMTISGSAAKTLIDGRITNLGTVVHNGGDLVINNGAGSGAIFTNALGGTYELNGNGTNIVDGNGANGTPHTLINQGVLRKSGGGTSTISVRTYENTGGGIDVQSGTLNLRPSTVTSTTTTVTTTVGGVLDLTGGVTVTYVGAFSGAGTGEVRLSGGLINVAAPGMSVNFDPGVFQWTGGTINTAASATTLTNTGTMALSGSAVTAFGGTLNNSGTIIHSGSGNFQLSAVVTFQPTRAGVLNNVAAAVYDLRSNAGLTSLVTGSAVNNSGIFRKSAGGGSSNISVPFNNTGGTIDLQSGALALSGGGTDTGGVFNSATGTLLSFSGTGRAMSGIFTGSGQGAVEINTGITVGSAGATVNFGSGLLQWRGGDLNAMAGAFSNVGTMTLVGTGNRKLFGFLNNAGTIIHSSTGNLLLENDGSQIGSTLTNLEGAIYDFQGDGNIINGSGDNGSPHLVRNLGTIRKSAGIGTSQITPFTVVNDGTIDVGAGTVRLGGRSVSGTNGTFLATIGAVLDLTGGASASYFGSFQGSGTGEVRLANGALVVPPPGLTFDFSPGLFQWTGGGINADIPGQSTTFTNLGTMTLAGTAVKSFAGLLNNSGMIVHQGTGSFQLQFQDFSVRNGRLSNLVGGVYDLQSNASIVRTNTDSTPRITNAGTFKKSAGTGASSINVPFESSGVVTIGAASTLNFIGNYPQSSTASLDLAIEGSPASGQFGRLTSTGNATLDGTLNVMVTSAYVPTVGDSFTVMNFASHTGFFPTVNGLELGNGLRFETVLSPIDLKLVVVANNAPVATPDSYFIAENHVLDVAVDNGVLSNDQDADDDPLSAILVSGPSHGSILLQSDGSFFYTPFGDYFGPDEFRYQAFDGSLSSPETFVSIDIRGENDAPIAVDDVLADVAEDTPSITISMAMLLGNDSAGPANENGQTLSVTVVGAAQGGTVQIVGSDVIFTPTADYNGPAGFEYTIEDNGTTNGAADPLSDVGLASFNIGEVNDAPIAVDDVLADVAEDTPSITIPMSMLLSNDSAGPANEIGQTLSVTVVGAAQGGTVQIVGSDVIFTPTADYNGPAGFEYTIEDNGTTNGAADPLSDVGLASFNIGEVNDAPIAVDDVLADVAEDTPSITIPMSMLLGNDSAGPVNENGQALSGTAVGAAQGGTVQIVGSDVIFTPTADYNGPAGFEYTIEDNGTTNGAADPLNDVATVSFIILGGNNHVPSITIDNVTVTVNEGVTALNTGTVSDPDSDAITLSASIGTISDNGDGTWSWSFDPIDGPDDSQNVTITVTDTHDESASIVFALIVDNVAPVLGTIDGPIDPTPVGNAISVSVSLSDDGIADTHNATWDWGDGSSSAGVVTETNGSGTASHSHVYTSAGVYTIALTLSDDDGGVAQSLFQYVVVYDPAAGFVTGGGWFDSPSGAYVADPGLVGKANFGFVSRYQHGATVPTGQTEFQFKVADLKFHSSQYEWLVVAGAKAQFKGTGTIQGTGNYGFIITATDGQISGGGGIDKFRIKIWDKANGDLVVYDNQLGATLDAAPTTQLGGGSIVIHKSGQPLLAGAVRGENRQGSLVTPEAIENARKQAIDYWQNRAWSSGVQEMLQPIEVHIADLDGLELARASESNHIWIDRDAAGYGWNFDTSPTQGMDLMSAVVHEMGHKLGFDHDVLGDSLVPGDRRLPDVRLQPGDANLDGVFDANDLIRLSRYSHYEDQFAQNSAWGTGDWDFDHEFTSADLVLAFQLGDYQVDDIAKAFVDGDVRTKDEVRRRKPKDVAIRDEIFARFDSGRSLAATDSRVVASKKCCAWDRL
jgi:hypothetical protein